MIEEKKEIVMLPQSTVIEKTCICDVCKKVIWKKNLLPDAKHNYSNNVGYYDITTGHHDWGNDSVESIKHHQVCEKCLKSFVAEYFDEANGTEYMDIQRNWLYSDVDPKTEEGLSNDSAL